METRLTLTLILGTFGERGVRGVGGIGGDIGVIEVGDTKSAGGGFLRELRGGRGGGGVSCRTPNSDVGSERRERVAGWRVLGDSSVFAGITGEGGKESADEDPGR